MTCPSASSGDDATAISAEEIAALKERLMPLVGVQLDVLRLPRAALLGFEPSQIGSIVGDILDACIPQLELVIPDHEVVHAIGLTRNPGMLKDREGYPDYLHDTGARVELKLLYVPPAEDVMKLPATKREPSARVGTNTTVKNVVPGTDILMVVAYRLEPSEDDADVFSPRIVDFELFSMSEVIAARDERLAREGFWFGVYHVPCVLSKAGKAKVEQGIKPDTSRYGRKEEEGRDFNEDTNFGKLKRIPYPPLKAFLKKHGY